MNMCQEEEMRRLVAAQRDLHGDTSQSDWSEVSEDEEPRGAETDGGLDQLSMAANGGLTDAEGAMSGGETERNGFQEREASPTPVASV